MIQRMQAKRKRLVSAMVLFTLALALLAIELRPSALAMAFFALAMAAA